NHGTIPRRNPDVRANPAQSFYRLASAHHRRYRMPAPRSRHHRRAQHSHRRRHACRQSQFPAARSALPNLHRILRRSPMVEEQLELRAKLCAAIEALDELIAQGHIVYLHCTAGIGRAPTVAIGYLHNCLGWQFEDAVTHVKMRRHCAPHLEALRLALADQAAAAEATDKETVTDSL